MTTNIRDLINVPEGRPQLPPHLRDEPLLGPSDLHNLPALPRAALQPIPRKRWPVVVAALVLLVRWLR